MGNSTFKSKEPNGARTTADDTKSCSDYFAEASNLSPITPTVPMSRAKFWNCGSDAVTKPETERDIDANGSTRVLITMDDRVSTPNERKHESFPNSPNQQAGNRSPVTANRYARRVHARIDLKYDESAEEHYDEGYNQEKRTEPNRKRRCISISELDAIIYLDLKQPVAIVSCAPRADGAIECDKELKTRLQQLLGLVSPRRRLYNPKVDCDLESNYMDVDGATYTDAQSIVEATISPMKYRYNKPNSAITNEMKILLFENLIQRINANYFERQTSQHIKNPIDLSGLPSMEQRMLSCQHYHKKIPNLLEQSLDLTAYSFLNSLKPETPCNMCHPLAVIYRKRDFNECRMTLATTLFHMFNHKIFHCGLHLSIAWQTSMSTPSTIVHRIKPGGQRASKIVLHQSIQHSGTLVKVLLHEMCHMAAFVYHGETGHGDNCRKWAYRAKSLLPELPQIDDCNPSYKYTCLLCRGRSVGLIKFENEEQQLRCHYCQFEVIGEPWIRNSHNLSYTDQLDTPFKQFARASYSKCEGSSHSSKMRALNAQYKKNTHSF